MWHITKINNNYVSQVGLTYTVEPDFNLSIPYFPLREGKRTNSLTIPFIGNVYFKDIGNEPLGHSTLAQGVLISYLEMRWVFRYNAHGELEVTIGKDGSLSFWSPSGGTVYPLNQEIPKTIESVHFHNVFLSPRGHTVTQPSGGGGGVVRMNYGAQAHEHLNIVKLPDGSYSIGSQYYPNVFIRMDGSGVHTPSGPGAGTVNCQFGQGVWEKFHLHKQDDGTYTIESVAFPGVFLRADGAGPQHYTDTGFGMVNCQWGASVYETFRIHGLE